MLGSLGSWHVLIFDPFHSSPVGHGAESAEVWRLQRKSNWKIKSPGEFWGSCHVSLHSESIIKFSRYGWRSSSNALNYHLILTKTRCFFLIRGTKNHQTFPSSSRSASHHPIPSPPRWKTPGFSWSVKPPPRPTTSLEMGPRPGAPSGALGMAEFDRYPLVMTNIAIENDH